MSNTSEALEDRERYYYYYCGDWRHVVTGGTALVFA